ncbi:MAG TPA: hypothetical protein VFQ43_06895 [Nitrososphaera sp.]|nr:hypothetical protein [Nitrososphaera sp.]
MALSAISVVTVGLILTALAILALYYVGKITARTTIREKAKKSSNTTAAVLMLVITASMLLAYPANATTQNYTNNCTLAERHLGASQNTDGTTFSTYDNWDWSLCGSDPRSGVPFPPHAYNGVTQLEAVASSGAFPCICHPIAESYIELQDSNFTVPNLGPTTSVTVAGAYSLYGFVHIEGTGWGFYPDAYLRVDLTLSGPQTYSWNLLKDELGQSDCSAGAGFNNCWKTIGEYTNCGSTTCPATRNFSETISLVPGTYTLAMTFTGHADADISGAAGATALSCFKTDGSPTPAMYQDNLCNTSQWCSCTNVPPTTDTSYRVQWDYTDYAINGNGGACFSISANPSSIATYPTATISFTLITTTSTNQGCTGSMSLSMWSSAQTIRIQFNLWTVTLVPGQTAGDLGWIYTSSTPVGSYTITISGTWATITQSTLLIVNVYNPPSGGGGGGARVD